MIAKIIRRAGFVEPCFYALKGALKRAEVLEANGVRTSSAGEMAADFELQRSMRPRLRQAVEHIALAWLPEETAKLTNEVMVQAAKLYMEERGIDPATTQWALVRHHDQKHPHGHLLLNRVTDDGQVLPDKKNHHASAVACRKVEAAMGFVDAAKLGAATKLKEAEQGKLPADVAERVHCKHLIRQALEKHLPTATTVRELREALATEGVRMKATMQQGGQLQAVVFEVDAYPGLHVKGSEVAREYSGVGLRKTLEAQAEHRIQKDATVTLPQQPAVPEPAAARLSTSVTSATLPASELPVAPRLPVTVSMESRVEVTAAPAETDKALLPALVAAQTPSVPQPEQNGLSLMPVVAAASPLAGAGGAGSQEAPAPPADRSLLGRVGPADSAAAASPVAGVVQPPLLPTAPEVAPQGGELRKAEQEAVALALASMERELACIAAKREEADQAERKGDYGLVAEIRYTLLPEAQQRLDAHQEQANATPAGRILADEIHAREQARLREAMKVEAAEQQRLAKQRIVDTARQTANAAQAEERRRADAALAAWQQAHQQAAECVEQAGAAKKRLDFALAGTLLREELPSAERDMRRCEAELRALPGAEAHVAQLEASKKDQLEQARAAHERQELDELDSFRRRQPYPGTHVRLQVPEEYLPAVQDAIGRRNSIYYDYEEHADKTISPRVVDGKIALNVLYTTAENDAKLDDALREFRRNGVEVFEQPADRTKREKRAVDARAFDQQYAEKQSRGTAFPGKEMDRPSQLER